MNQLHNKLNQLNEQIKLNEAYDREMERLRNERQTYGAYRKTREQTIKEKNKRRDPGGY